MKLDYPKFWDEKHLEDNATWLTGSSLEEIKHHYRLQDRDFADLLEIGVGTGSLIEDIIKADIQCNYIPCDISKQALVRFAGKKYLTTQLNKIRPVNLAIAHLVFQHCEPEEVERIINNVQLTSGGIFCFQVAVLRKKEELSDEAKECIEHGVLNFTTVKEVKEIIDRSNKRLISVSDKISHGGRFNFDWYIFKVCNEDN